MFDKNRKRNFVLTHELFVAGQSTKQIFYLVLKSSQILMEDYSMSLVLFNAHGYFFYLCLTVVETEVTIREEKVED